MNNHIDVTDTATVMNTVVPPWSIALSRLLNVTVKVSVRLSWKSQQICVDLEEFAREFIHSMWRKRLRSILSSWNRSVRSVSVSVSSAKSRRRLHRNDSSVTDP